MIELLSALVSNGTTYYAGTYEPWLPFYNFVPIAILASVVMWFVTRARLESVMLLVSEFTALIPTYLIWLNWDLDAYAVFGVWLVNTALIFGGQVWLWDYSSHAFNHRRGPDSIEEYMEHVRTEHPKIWREIQEREKKKNGD